MTEPLEGNASPARVTRPGDGRLVAVVGDVYRFLAVGADTQGRYALWEATVPPGGGPPPHIHRREDEGFYVLEGEVTIQAEDERIVAGPGAYVHLPVGRLHTFRNEGEQTARMLISVVPAGLEEMFFEVGQPVADPAHPPAATAAEIDRLLSVAPRYGIEIRLPRK